MKKIAFISTMNGSAWGGSEELWTEAAMYALESGYNVFISIVDWGTLHPKISNLKQHGAIVHLRKGTTNRNSFFRKITDKVLNKLVRKETVYKSLLRFAPDVICINQGGSYDFIYQDDLIDLVQTTTIPYCLLCHFNWENGVLNDRERIAAKKIFTKAQNVFFVSERNRDTCRRQLMIDMYHSIIVRNPINISDHTYIPWYDQEIVNFASVARLDCNYKGQDILLEVLAADAWKNRNWILNIYGSGKDKEYLKELASYFKINQKVIFHDHVADVREIWKRNHLLVMSSIGEGTPLSLVEAMICGRPSVITDVGGNAAYITEGFTGFIAESPSPANFSSAMERAWKAKDKWKELGKNAHDLAIRRIDATPGKSLLDEILTPKT